MYNFVSVPFAFNILMMFSDIYKLDLSVSNPNASQILDFFQIGHVLTLTVQSKVTLLYLSWLLLLNNAQSVLFPTV